MPETNLLFFLSIAKQLSTGAAKLATLNGKQVLISTQPTVINQAQKLPSAPGVTTPMTVSGGAGSNPVPASTPMTTVASPAAPPAVSTVQAAQQPLPQNAIPNNVKLPSEPLPPTAIKPSVDPPKPEPTPVGPTPAQVTAQLIQTPQGPRIVLQGIQGIVFDLKEAKSHLLFERG